MAVKLIANYAKRLGLPGYSSHQFSVSVETEVVNVTDIQAESERLYATLQKAVDEQMMETGFVPEDGYGMMPLQNGSARLQPNGNGSNGHSEWRCSAKQRELILKVIAEQSLEKSAVDQIARQMFGKQVPELNKLEASGLIDELLASETAPPARAGTNGSRATNGRQS